MAEPPRAHECSTDCGPLNSGRLSECSKARDDQERTYKSSSSVGTERRGMCLAAHALRLGTPKSVACTSCGWATLQGCQRPVLRDRRCACFGPDRGVAPVSDRPAPSRSRPGGVGGTVGTSPPATSWMLLPAKLSGYRDSPRPGSLYRTPGTRLPRSAQFGRRLWTGFSKLAAWCVTLAAGPAAW